MHNVNIWIVANARHASEKSSRKANTNAKMLSGKRLLVVWLCSSLFMNIGWVKQVNGVYRFNINAI